MFFTIIGITILVVVIIIIMLCFVLFFLEGGGCIYLFIHLYGRKLGVEKVSKEKSGLVRFLCGVREKLL